MFKFFYLLFCGFCLEAFALPCPSMKTGASLQVFDKEKLLLSPKFQTKPQQQNKSSKAGTQIELRLAVFFPQDRVFRHLYHKGFLPKLAINQVIYENLLLCFDLGYMHKHGHVQKLDVDFPTSVTQVPIDLGLGYRCVIKKGYSLIGSFSGTYVYTNTKQDSPYFTHQISKHAGGFLVGLTAEMKKNNGFLIDFFINYRYAKRHINDRINNAKFDVFLGGIEAGLGIGYSF